MEDDDFQSRLADWSTRNVGNEPEEQDEEEQAPVVQDEPQAEQAQAPFSEDQLSGFMERNSPSRIGMYLGNAVHSFNSTMGDIAATLNAGIGTMVRERDGVNKLGIVMRGGQNVLDANAEFARKARVGEELLALDNGEVKEISEDAKKFLSDEAQRRVMSDPSGFTMTTDEDVAKEARQAAQSKEWQQTREDSLKYLQNRARENGFAFNPKSQRSDAWESEFMEQMRLSDMARNTEQRKPLNDLPDREVVLRSPEQIWNQRASDRVHEAEAAYNAHSAASQASRTFFNDAISNNLVDINAQNEYLHNLGFKYGGEKGEGFWGRTGETLERMLVDVTDQTGNITLMLAAQGAVGLAAKASAAAQGATAVAGGAVAEAATSLGMADVAMAATRTAAVNTAKSVGLQAMGRALQAGFIASEFQGAMDEARDLGIPDAEAARHAMEYGVVAGILENAGQIINVAGLNGKTVSKFGRAVFGNKAFSPEALATLAGTMKQAGVKIGARIIDQVADATGEGLEEITQTTAQGMAMAAVIDEYCDRHNLNKAEFLAAHDGAPYKIGKDGTVRYDIGKAVEEIRESGLAGAGSAFGTALLGMGGGVAKRAFRGRTAAVAGVSAVTGLNATRLEAVYGDNACEVVAHALAGVRNDEDVAKRREILANEVSDEDFGEDALRLFDYCIDNAKVTETAAMSGLSSKFQVPASMNEGWEESDGGALWSYSNDGITIVQDVVNNEITVLNEETGQTVKADSPNAALAAANRYSIENQARQAVLANRVEYFGNMMQRLAPEDFKRTSVYMTTREALEKEPDIRNSLIADIGEDVVAAAREIGGDEAVNALLESKFEGGTLNDGRIVFAADKMSGPWKMMQLINHETTHSGILSANSWDKKKSADFIRNMNVAKPQGFDAEAERGFRGLTESQRNSFAWQFWMRADRIKRNLGYEEGSPKLMEETIAYFFQDRANRPSMWSRMKHALFQTLRDNAGRNIALQESDIEVMVDAWRHDPSKLTKNDKAAPEAPAAKSETTPTPEPMPAPKAEATPKVEPTPAAAPKTETPTLAPETATPETAPAAKTETPVETAAAKPSNDEKAPEVKQPKVEETPVAKAEMTPAPETTPKAENAAPAEESAKTSAEWLAEKGIAIHKGTYDAVTKKLAESKDHDTVFGVLERRILPENAPALSRQTRKALVSKLNKMGFRVNEKSTDTTLLRNLLEKYTDETGRAAPASASTTTPAAATPAESKTQTKARGPSAYITPTEKSRTIPISKLRTLKDEPQKSIDNAWGFMEKAARGEADKRKPIHVVDNGDGTFTVIDGNATTWAMARHGESEIIAEVVGKDRGTRIANSHYEIQEEGVKDADGNKIALRAGGFDGMDVKSEAAREKAYADAEENLPALEELTRKAAAKVGGEVMLHPENKAGADTDEREVGKRVKKRSRVEDKKADYKGDYSGVVDLIGTTITLTPDKDMSDAVKAIRKNLPEGASVARVKFLSNPDKGGYWDVKVSVRFANGGIGEIIVADAYLTEAKFGRGGHELYDYQRALEEAKETDAEAADLYFALKQIELAIYSHNTPQAEAWRAEWDSAKATASSSLTRFLASHGRDFISSIDMGSLKDLLSGTHLHQPASLDSYATPAFSFIQNDISSSSSNDNNIIAESGEKGKKEVGQTAPAKASNSFSVITPDGEMTVEGKWEAVPADKIVTSFDPRYKQFERHMQNRITTGKTNEQKVEKYANNPLYRMAGNSEISDTGAAFGVWHDGLCYIVAGNHHTRGIQLSFERGKGTQFEADARADMERRGVKVPDGNFIPIRIIDGMTREQLVEFADKSNQRATQEHRDGEKAVKDVPIIKKHISKLHADADLTSRDNIDFVEALLKEFKDESLRNSDLTPNDKAYRRVRLALVASVLSATDEDAATTLTQVFAEKAESLGLQNIIDGVTRAAAPVLSATDAAKGTDLDFGRHLAEALRAIVDFKQNGGKSMKAFLAQEGFDFGDKQALSSEAKALVQAIAENANAPQRISALLSDIATRVEKTVGERDQAGLFAAEEAPSLAKIVDASIEAMSGKASEAEVDALRNRAPAFFDALWEDKDGTSEALSEVERQMNHVRDSKDKSSAIRPFKGEARKQAMKYWGAEHPAGKSKLAPGPVTVKPETPAKSETAKPAEAPAAPEAPAQAPAPQTSTKAKKPAAKPRATKATMTEEAAPAPVSQTPATPQAPTAQQGGTTIAGVELSADDIKAFSDLGSGIMASFSRGDVDADTVSKGNQFVGLAVQRGVKDFRTFATLAKRFVYGKADDERRAGVQNFLAARWSQYLMDNPDSGIEEMLPSKMRTVFDEIDNEQTAPAPAPTQENTQNQEQKNEAPSTNETREEASENPVKEPEANPVERTETQREPPKPVKRETSPRAPAKAKHTVVGKPLQPIIAAAPTSRGARLAANIEAIRIAKELDTTGRTATEAEREKLAKFTGWGVRFSIREEDPPKNTGIGYKVFFLKDGKLYPPMVANPGGADTPIGVWLNADEGVRAEKSKNGRDKVKAGGKGTQGGGGTLAWRPGWHLGTIPYALQFNRGEKVDNPLGIMNQKGEVIKVGRFFPANFVWAEVEYAADVDYQEEAMSYGMTPNGKFQHSLAGLPRLPKDGFYQYRTNANPATDPWIITGAMRVRRVLSDDEVDALVREAGREPQEREARFTADDAKSVNSHLTLPGGKVIDAADAWQYRDGADKLHATRWSKFLGRAVTQELDGVLDRLMSGEEVPESEIEATPEWSEAKARAAIDESGLQKKYGANVKATADIDTEERKALRHEIIEAALAPVVQHQVEIGSTGLKFTMNEALEPKKGKPAPMPYTVAQDHVAIVVTGLPSAGKSSVFVNAVSTFYKARVCDSDAVKAALPEFDNGYGGNAVHNESSNINEEILDRATRRGDNVVYPILGFKAESLRNKILKELRARGYNVHILCNDLPPAKATARLIMRFLEKGRYLPLFCIYKAAGKTQPAYQEVKNEYDSYALYSNDVSFGERPRRIESSRGGILEAVPAFQGSVGEPTVLRPAVGSQGIIRDGTGEVGNGTVLQMAGEPSATSGLDDGGAAFSRSDESRFEVTPEEAAAIRALDIHGGKNYLVGASQLARFYSQHEYSPERLTKENVWEESFGIDAPALVSEIVKKPRVLTPYEHAAMVRHLASYEARLDALTQKQNELEKTPGTPTETLATLDNEIAVLGGAIKTIYAAFDYAGTKAGQALAFRNLIQNAEMTAGWMIRRMKTQMENFHVDAMPTGFMDELERFAREYKQVKQDLETAQGELVRKDAEAEQMNEILRNLRNRPKKDPGTRLAEIMSQTQDLVDAQGELSDYQIEKLVKKVAAEYVALDSSYRDIDTLLGEVRKYLDIAGIELDDAQIREYFAGRANIYDRNEARKLANRLQKQVAKAVALEEALQNGDIREMRRVCRRLGLAIHDGQAIIDAQNAAILAMLDDEIAELEAELGEKPKPTMFSIDENPKAPRPAGRKSAAADVADNGKARLERLRALRAEIANADADDTRTARIREYARSRLASEQARLQNIIGKTHENAGTVPSASTPELEEAERELRHAEREEREARGRGEQNTARQEQKRIARLREKVAALEKQVLDAQEGFFQNDMPKMKKRRAMTAEESALVQRIAELRHAYRTLLDAQFPGEQLAEERAIRARQRAIQRSIEHLQNKMEGSEQAQNQPKKDYSNDPRLDDLKKQLREKKKEYLDWEAAQNWKAMSTGDKALKTLVDLLDYTKSVVASGDLSAIWTQCGWMMMGNPRLSGRAVRDGLFSLFSGKRSEEIMNKLARDYDLARFVEDGLKIHTVGTAAESEMFARNSNPVLNKLLSNKVSDMWLEASARGFDTPVNIIRATTYAAALNACQKNGKMLGEKERQTLAQLINYATGTGDFKLFNNGFFKRVLWAPSRISGQIQTIQNMINLGLSSISENIATRKFRDIDLDVRRTMFKQVYGKSLGNWALLTAVLYALSHIIWDDEDDDKRIVGKEFFWPLSAKFLKFNIGGNYVSPLGGIEIYIRTAARIIANGRVDRYGRFVEFDKFQNGSAIGELGKTFILNKLSPPMQLAAAAINRGTQFETLETPEQILRYVVQNTVYPLTLHDSVEALTENGIPTGAALTLMNFVGLSSWSYGHVKRDTAVRNFNASLKAYNEFARAGDTVKLRELMNRYDWLKPQYRVRLTNLAGQYRKLADKNKKMIAAGHANANMMARQAQLAEQIYAIMHETETQ